MNNIKRPTDDSEDIDESFIMTKVLSNLMAGKNRMKEK